jgi:hypothetical protein
MTAAQGCNYRCFGVLGAEAGDLELCRLQVGIAGDWEPRSALQVGIVRKTDLPAEIVGAVVCAGVAVALAADRLADTAPGICLVDSVGRAAAASLGS